MKVATFNIQNIFSRHKALLCAEKSLDFIVLTKELDTLIYRMDKTEEDYGRMRKLSEMVGFGSESIETKDSFVDYEMALRRKENTNSLAYNGATLYRKRKILNPDFEGLSIEAIRNKALAIRNVDADILVLQEVESREALMDFNRYFLRENRNGGYENILYMPTNDIHGRGMGLLLKKGYAIKSIVSNVNQKDTIGRPIFDKDLQEYDISLPEGGILKVFNAHFRFFDKNRSETSFQITDQAKKTRKIVQEYLENNIGSIIVLGTLNAPKGSALLSDLLSDTTLKQIRMHKTFNAHLENGTSLRNLEMEYLDYMLIMRKDNDKVISCGISGRHTSDVRGILWAKWKDYIFNRQYLKKIA